MRHTITIKVREKYTALRMIRGLVMTSIWVGVIYLGVLADSAAMQWLGFSVILISLVAWALVLASKQAEANEDLTFGEARARIDELERQHSR